MSVRRPKLVLLSEVFPPERTATARFLGAAAQSLARHFDVVVVAGRPRYALDSSASWFNGAGVVVRRPSGATTRARSIAGRLWQAAATASFMSRVGRDEARDADIVMCVTNPPLAPVVAGRCASAANVPMVVLVHDLYPEVLSVAGIVPAATPGYSLLDRFLSRPLRKATRIIVLGRDAKELVSKKTGSRVAVDVIPNFATVEPQSFSDARVKTLRKTLGLREKFVVAHIGNFGRTHDVETVLNAATTLRDSHPTMHFVLVGEGFRFQTIAQRIARESLANVTLLPSVSDKDLPDYLQVGDVSLISFLPGMSGVSVPSRLYNHLAAGRPIVGVCDADSELGRVLIESGAGWVFRPGDAAGLANGLAELAAQPDRVSQAGAHGVEEVRRYYTPEIIDQAYQRLAQELLRGRNGATA